ncbi:MAG: cupredoxin domain-containing protein [Acidimicrobiia bacterium]|nr:cupredoxin domain-containing protein [Acidimicrobiia bacterium]
MAKGDGRWRTGSLAAASLALAVVAAGCVPKSSATAEPKGTGQEVSVDAQESRFSPRIIEVEANKPLTVKVHNSGLRSHTFTTGDQAADVVVGRGETKSVTFNPRRSINFFCRFHEPNGMKGSLCVEGQSCTPQRFP